MKQKVGLKTFFLLLCFLPAASLLASSDSHLVQIKEPWRDVFAGQTAVFHITGTASDVSSTSVLWRLSYNNRTLVQGTVDLDIHGPDAPLAELKLPVPSIESGIMIPADLVLQTTATAAPLLTEKIYIFPSDPFIQKKQWLTDLKIALFDPEKTTRDAFEQIGLPFQIFSNPEALPSFEGKLFIVGQNVDFDQNPELWNGLRTLAQRNIPVLILAPHKGRLSLTDNTAPSSIDAPEQLVLSRETMIRTFDKTLDTSWAPDGRTSITGLKITTEEKDVYAQVDPGPGSWPWTEITLKSGGKLVICGFDITGTAQQSPAPRYFIARLIDYLINSHSKEDLK
jgi:hypothetical protein